MKGDEESVLYEIAPGLWGNEKAELRMQELVREYLKKQKPDKLEEKSTDLL